MCVTIFTALGRKNLTLHTLFFIRTSNFWLRLEVLIFDTHLRLSLFLSCSYFSIFPAFPGFHVYFNSWEHQRRKNRSSRSQMFFKTGVLKYLAIFTRKHLSWSLFLILQKDSNTGAFL